MNHVTCMRRSHGACRRSKCMLVAIALDHHLPVRSPTSLQSTTAAMASEQPQSQAAAAADSPEVEQITYDMRELLQKSGE